MRARVWIVFNWLRTRSVACCNVQAMNYWVIQKTKILGKERMSIRF